MKCEKHDVEMVWVEDARRPGRKTLCCLGCRSVEYADDNEKARLHPLLRFSKTWHRDVPDIKQMLSPRDR